MRRVRDGEMEKKSEKVKLTRVKRYKNKRGEQKKKKNPHNNSSSLLPIKIQARCHRCRHNET